MTIVNIIDNCFSLVNLNKNVIGTEYKERSRKLMKHMKMIQYITIDVSSYNILFIKDNHHIEQAISAQVLAQL